MTQLGNIWNREAQQFTELKELYHNEISKEFANSIRKFMRNMNIIKVSGQTYSTLKFVLPIWWKVSWKEGQADVDIGQQVQRQQGS